MKMPKSIFALVLASLLMGALPTALAAGRASKSMEISCQVVGDENTVVLADVYSFAGGLISHAVVSVVDVGQPPERVVEKYRLPIRDAGEVSMFLEFENKTRSVSFTASGDDVGGMSSLVVNGSETILTCGVEDL